MLGVRDLTQRTQLTLFPSVKLNRIYYKRGREEPVHDLRGEELLKIEQMFNTIVILTIDIKDLERILIGKDIITFGR